jgi:5-methyltetrahydrofolate--homocysteine methyltransferase
MKNDLPRMSELVQTGNAKEVAELVKKCLGAGMPAREILNDGLLSGMAVVGEKFRMNEVFVPEVLIATRALKRGIDTLRPVLVREGAPRVGVVVIATVAGDIHDIGKNLVAMSLESVGFEVVDLGIDVSVNRIVEAVRETKAGFLALSSLLTITMPNIEVTIEAIKEAGLRDSVVIAVGGAPVTQNFCDRVGADIYAKDAITAAQITLAAATGKAKKCRGKTAARNGRAANI